MNWLPILVPAIFCTLALAFFLSGSKDRYKRITIRIGDTTYTAQGMSGKQIEEVIAAIVTKHAVMPKMDNGTTHREDEQ